MEFSVSIKDLREEVFRGSGNGGQKKQKTSSGVRLTHAPSGVQVEDESTRSQHKNRLGALRKLAAHPKFLSWCQAESDARRAGFKNLEAKVDNMMKDENLKIEVTAEHAPGETYCDVK